MLTESLRYVATALDRGATLPRPTPFAPLAALLLALVLPLCLERAVWAQAAKKDAGAAAAQTKPAAPQPKEKRGKDKGPDLTPVDVGGNDLMTQDGVQLRATFYPGSKGRQSVPVILLHSYKGDRKEFNTLAPYLQQQGHAVLAPDLRGHGESVNTKMGITLDVTKMPFAQCEEMVYKDMTTLKRFLAKKNDEEELNLSKLCVVGCELGALVALNWARYDWTSLTGEVPPMDVRALVLISPPRTQCGLDTRQALSHPLVRTKLSMMILVGKEKGVTLADDTKRLYNLLKRFHPEPPANQAAEKKDLFYGEIQTKLQGSKMLGVPALNVERFIAQFIQLRLVNQKSPEFNWRERRK